MRVCGDFGHTNKNGKPCSFILNADQTVCLHHDKDRRREQAAHSASVDAVQFRRLPGAVKDGGYQTPDDCLRVLAKLTKIAATRPLVDIKRLAEMRGCALGANEVHKTKEMKRQTDVLESLARDGATVEEYRRLLQAPVRPMPRKKRLTVVVPVEQEATG